MENKETDNGQQTDNQVNQHTVNTHEMAEIIEQTAQAQAETSLVTADENTHAEVLNDASQNQISSEQILEATGDALHPQGSVTPDEEHDMLLQQVTEHVIETSEHLAHYEQMSKAELAHALKAIVDADDTLTQKQKVRAIRDAYQKIKSHDDATALAKFIEDGGIKTDFENRKSADDIVFESLYEKYKTKSAAQAEKAEKQKQDNLVAKQTLVSRLKNLIQHEENMQKAYTEFNEIQNQWRLIGAVPTSDANELQLNYKTYINRFYDFVKINRELQAYDQQKNLILKINVCERAEQLMLEPSINRALSLINNMMNEWRDIGPVSRDQKDEIWKRFKGAVDKVFERKREHEESLKGQHDENLKLKLELIEKITPIVAVVHEKHQDWQDALKEVMQISDGYKKVGHAARKENEEAWVKFKGLCDVFFKNKNDFYQSRKKENVANTQLKTELCIAAEGLQNSEDWKTATQELVRLQEEWKKIGHIYDKVNQKLWLRFKTACDTFFNRKNQHFSSQDSEQENNYTAKIQLIETVEQFILGENNQHNLDQLKEFQRQWSAIGLVPLKKKDEVHQRFRQAIDNLYNNLKLDEREKTRSRYQTGEGQYHQKHSGGKGRTESGMLNSKISELANEVTVWQNNIGFFSKSKNADAIRKEFEEKINAAKTEIDALKQKLKALKESE